MSVIIKTLKKGLDTIAYSTITKAITHFGSKHNNKRLDQVIDTMQEDIDSRALSTDLIGHRVASRIVTGTTNGNGNIPIGTIDNVMSAIPITSDIRISQLICAGTDIYAKTEVPLTEVSIKVFYTY